MKKKCCKCFPLWTWSYNNPKWNTQFLKIYHSLKEIDEILDTKKRGKKQSAKKG